MHICVQACGLARRLIEAKWAQAGHLAWVSSEAFNDFSFSMQSEKVKTDASRDIKASRHKARRWSSMQIYSTC